jgi:hypothetical protein
VPRQLLFLVVLAHRPQRPALLFLPANPLALQPPPLARLSLDLLLPERPLLLRLRALLRLLPRRQVRPPLARRGPHRVAPLLRRRLPIRLPHLSNSQFSCRFKNAFRPGLETLRSGPGSFYFQSM